MSEIVRTIDKPKLSFKVQTVAAAAAVVGAVLVPQIFHLLGAVTGLGTALGETFLPMHLPIILVGLLAGPYAGAVSGLLGPLASYALSGMPKLVMLPFMMIELCAYGLFAGLLRNVKMPTLLKVLLVQLSGRLVRAAAILAAIYLFDYGMIKTSVIWLSIKTGLFGIAFQWLLIPLIIYRIENGRTDER